MNQNQNQNQNQPLNPGLSEREIEEILASSGVINGNVTNGIKLGSAIADIITKNNQLLIEAIQSGNVNRAPYDDPAKGPHQTSDPSRMWEAGTAPGTQMPESSQVTPPAQS
ncbi:hypothetical protein [Tumebacillus permanentifrigoris]|uniref:Uncharacterized protein n=1 Tax=Tumebacillus permanentifrigoris TaxID=378543 RepID=A0A316D295_9BACL|nr:hypothetical protein [Tumebacillus permanentifrigoris]PWK04993.1 hypothetical protein C7459_1307 [Tumebacillus permanentifrigoris]